MDERLIFLPFNVFVPGARVSFGISESLDCRMSNGVWITVFGVLPDNSIRQVRG